LGGTGKTGRRVANRLQDKGVSTRIASRAATPTFDWSDQSSWQATLDGRNAHLCDVVQRALGREPVDFADYARSTAASGVWKVTT